MSTKKSIEIPSPEQFWILDTCPVCDSLARICRPNGERQCPNWHRWRWIDGKRVDLTQTLKTQREELQDDDQSPSDSGVDADQPER